MNNRLLPITIAATIGVISNANAADGTISFTGAISDQTCIVESGSTNLTVEMGTISDSAFSAAGDTAGASRFDISLESCPSFTSVAARFDGVADSDNPDLLALTDTGSAATGVAIQISNTDGTAIGIGNESTQFPIDAGSATLNFIAKYQATAATVTAGDANSTAQFTITYY